MQAAASAMVKADSKGTLKEFSKADFEIPAGVSPASYGKMAVGWGRTTVTNYNNSERILKYALKPS